MEIKVTKLTDASLMRKVAGYTTGRESHIDESTAYRSEHSIIRSQIYLIEMVGVPTFVSTHFARHKIGVEHFIKSNRDDRGGNGDADRNTPVNHAMIANAQALISMSHVRLCAKAHEQTRKAMALIRQQISEVDPALAVFMVRKCVYRGGICGEPKGCGYNLSGMFQKSLMQYKQRHV